MTPLLFIIVSLIATLNSSNQWMPHSPSGIQYNYITTCMNWDVAQKHCISLGGELASAHLQTQRTFIVTTVIDTPPINQGCTSWPERGSNQDSFGIWLGAQHNGTDKTSFEHTAVHWFDGTWTPFSDMDWDLDEPNSYSNHKGIALHYPNLKFHTSYLGDSGCALVCQKVLASQSPTASPITPSPTTTNNPTENPTKTPTNDPSEHPTKTPTTNDPSENPTTAPTTSNPTNSPTRNPTQSPAEVAVTSNPSQAPVAVTISTSNPTQSPVEITSNPSQAPVTLLTSSSNPTRAPSVTTSESTQVSSSSTNITSIATTTTKATTACTTTTSNTDTQSTTNTLTADSTTQSASTFTETDDATETNDAEDQEDAAQLLGAVDIQTILIFVLAGILLIMCALVCIKECRRRSAHSAEGPSSDKTASKEAHSNSDEEKATEWHETEWTQNVMRVPRLLPSTTSLSSSIRKVALKMSNSQKSPELVSILDAKQAGAIPPGALFQLNMSETVVQQHIPQDSKLSLPHNMVPGDRNRGTFHYGESSDAVSELPLSEISELQIAIGAGHKKRHTNLGAEGILGKMADAGSKSNLSVDETDGNKSTNGSTLRQMGFRQIADASSRNNLNVLSQKTTTNSDVLRQVADASSSSNLSEGKHRNKSSNFNVFRQMADASSSSNLNDIKTNKGTHKDSSRMLGQIGDASSRRDLMNTRGGYKHKMLGQIGDAASRKNVYDSSTTKKAISKHQQMDSNYTVIITNEEEIKSNPIGITSIDAQSQMNVIYHDETQSVTHDGLQSIATNGNRVALPTGNYHTNRGLPTRKYTPHNAPNRSLPTNKYTPNNAPNIGNMNENPLVMMANMQTQGSYGGVQHGSSSDVLLSMAQKKTKQ